MSKKLIALIIVLAFHCTNAFAEPRTISLPARNGSTITGVRPGDYLGETIMNVGDINGDWIPDFLVTARNFPGGPPQGVAYLIFGRPQGQPVKINMSEVGSTIPGVKIYGTSEGIPVGAFGAAVAAGDVNGDGVNDMLITEPGYKRAYLIYGSKNFPVNINVTQVGRTIEGVRFTNVSGYTAAIGDYNGDGKSDVILEGINKDVYAIYGGLLTGDIVLSTNTITTSIGVVMMFPFTSSEPDFAHLSAADINRDGFADLLVASKDRAAYIVFGRKNPLNPGPVTIDDVFLNGINGVKLVSDFGVTINPVGDINQDGFVDLGVYGVKLYSSPTKAGVIFGKADWSITPLINLNKGLDGNNGFLINGLTPESNSLVPMGTAGNYNSDGFSDLMIADPKYFNGSGRVAVIFGRAAWPAVYDLSTDPADGSKSVQFTGRGYIGTSVSYMPNIPGDVGCGNDFAYLFGAPGYKQEIGKAYIVNIRKP